MTTNWNQLREEHELVYFRADVCLSSPQSFRLDEKREICEQMESTNKAIENAMRRDFEQLPPGARGKLLDMLCQSGVETPEWWWNTLAGEGQNAI